MNTFKPLQRKNQFTSIPAVPTYPSLRPSRTLVSRPIPDSDQAHPVTQAPLEHAARFGHSFGRVSLFPPGKKNDTGLPDALKTGIENLSGMSLDDANVHYHSSRPAQVQALAYTQGTDIHVGPGQERHLAHEAWHVVQQKQGRVQPTLQARDAAINDDEELEKEAEVMGEKAYHQIGNASWQGNEVSSSGLVGNHARLTAFSNVDPTPQVQTDMQGQRNMHGMQPEDAEPSARDGSARITGVIQGVFLRRANGPPSPNEQEQAGQANGLESVLKQEMLPKAIQQLRDLFVWARDHYTLSNPPPIHGVFVPFFGPDTSRLILIDRITTVITNLLLAMQSPWNVYNSSDDQSGVPPPGGAIGYESGGDIYLTPAFYQQHFAIQYDTLLHEALHATAGAIDIPGLNEGTPVNSFDDAMAFAIASPDQAVDCAYNLTLFTLVAARLLQLP